MDNKAININNRDIFVHKIILVLVFIPFGLHNYSSNFYSISLLVFIQFYENNFRFYFILVLVQF